MTKMLSVTEYSKQTGKDVGTIRKLIGAGRLPAIKIGNQWCIEEWTPWPADKRVKSGKSKDWRKPKSEAQTEE